MILLQIYPLYPRVNSRMHTISLTEQIHGNARGRILREFVINSALFPFFEAIRSISTDGFMSYSTDLSHYIMFMAAAVQAWYLGRKPSLSWQQRAMGNFIAPSIYTFFDILLKGFVELWVEPSIWIFWVFAVGMALFYALEGAFPRYKMLLILLMNLWRVLLLPVLYTMSEFFGELHGAFGETTLLQYYHSSSGHAFILMAALTFGVLLGLREIQVERYLNVLRQIASRLKQVSEWSLSPTLLEESLLDVAGLNQHRVQRTILFMDIRSFTQWSETKDPETILIMLNRFYEMAETIIVKGGGNKPHFIGDEVMTWFADPKQALDTAITLNQQISALLRPYNLAVGTGVHLGEVVEGLVGTSGTRNYNIIGDAVNTASRLVSVAKPDEILISDVLAREVGMDTTSSEFRTVQVKGKHAPIKVWRLM